MRASVTILGCGTSTGVPVIGCDCSVCTGGAPQNQRTRASLMLTLPGGERIVIDTAPEFRLQMVREKVSKVGHVLYTHLHADHCHGFDDIRQFYFRHTDPVVCHVHERDEADFRKRFAYAFENTGYIGTKPQVELRTFAEAPFSLYGVSIEPFTLPHGPFRTTAFRFGRFLYATDFKAFPKQLIEKLRGKVDTVVASAVHFGTHPSHSTVPETVALLEQLEVTRGVLTHMGHEIDVLRDVDKLRGPVEYGHDGLTFDVEL